MCSVICTLYKLIICNQTAKKPRNVITQTVLARSSGHCAVKISTVTRSIFNKETVQQQPHIMGHQRSFLFLILSSLQETAWRKNGLFYFFSEKNILLQWKQRYRHFCAMTQQSTKCHGCISSDNCWEITVTQLAYLTGRDHSSALRKTRSLQRQYE